jgi:hypothetical protein
MISKSIFFILWLLIFTQSCRSIYINTTHHQNKTIAEVNCCPFNKEWLEKHFNVKNIIKIDSEYDGTIFIIMFKAIHHHDAKKLLNALKRISEDVHMTETTSFHHIYLSKKTAEKIYQLNHK